MRDWQVMDGNHLLRAILVLIAGFGAALTEKAFAETTAEMSLKPERCVALNEGQTCYQTVTVQWQSPVLADYCLFEQNVSEPLVCWQGAKSGKAKVQFQSDTNVTYRLMLGQPPEEMVTSAESEIVVTWVYSKTKKRKNSWRLF